MRVIPVVRTCSISTACMLEKASGRTAASPRNSTSERLFLRLNTLQRSWLCFCSLPRASANASPRHNHKIIGPCIIVFSFFGNKTEIYRRNYYYTCADRPGVTLRFGDAKLSFTPVNCFRPRVRLRPLAKKKVCLVCSALKTKKGNFPQP